MNITLLKCLSAAQYPKEPFHNPPAIALFVSNFCQLYGLIYNGNASLSALCVVEALDEKLKLNELGP